LTAACVVAGPLPALWPLGGLALYAALARSWDVWRQARPVAGGAMILGAALPWYGALAERRGAAFLAHVPAFPYGAGEHGSWLAAPAVALSFFVAGFFPWSAVLPSATLHAAAWWRGARGLLRIGARGPEIATGAVEREWREEGAAHLFVASLVAALIPMIVYPSPPLTAVLPALPAGALLCGRFLDHLFESPERVARPLARALPLLALSGTAGAVMLALIASRVPEAAAGVRLLATTMFVTSWLPLLAGLLGRRRLAAVLVALPVTVGAPIATFHLLPQLEGVLSARGVAQAMNLVSPPASPLVVLDPEPPTLRWYLRRNIAYAAPVGSALRQWRASDGETYLAFRPAREREVLRAAAAPLEILLRTETLVLARVRVE
ncbi:MAG TPA: hypothetical protein VFK69_03140, partial [Candidatus Eisenbacteria bacterium]|nr:hypothetical protein [Candidatus Eisenbacteria bacterium]